MKNKFELAILEQTLDICDQKDKIDKMLTNLSSIGCFISK